MMCMSGSSSDAPYPSSVQVEDNFIFLKMSAARILSLRENLVTAQAEHRALGHAIKAQVRQQRVKSWPVHIARVIYALATAPNIIVAKYLKSANVRGESEEDLVRLAEESFLMADLQEIVNICDEQASSNRLAWLAFFNSVFFPC